ncbi:hypothetical protein PVL29_005025 [Vitis rotundifolia]|uniref:Flavanone 4-reductase n=1 Tax=Vitis rotundifolia TaxID=103349 RepID=A0AA39AA68_VITRO|nr:hypothetical protein PVL29_005025 [Vitis rotundifolia]
MEAGATTVCVTGAAAFTGSWLVMRLLERGYTVRDPADTHLTLWKADLTEEGSFDEAIQGCFGVFHVATPMDFESKDPENEVIKPTINGVLSIIKSCAKAGSVRRLVFTQSAGTVNVEEQRRPEYDESCWSDLEFINDKKMPGWDGCTLCQKHWQRRLQGRHPWRTTYIEFVSVIPTLVVGPFITPTMPPSLITALSPLTGNEAHCSIVKQCRYIRLDDLFNAHIYLYEFKDIDRKLKAVCFSSKKLTDLGFQFKYSLEDMYKGAIETCREKGLIPLSSEKEKHANGEN